MMHSHSFAWILISLLTLTLAAPLQADIIPGGDVDPASGPPDYWWFNGGNSSTKAYIGKTTTGSVTVNLGSDLSSGGCHIGYESSSTGEVTVDGADSTWANRHINYHGDNIYVGYNGSGTLNITDGGTVSNDMSSHIGHESSSTGEVTVNGSGSTWTNGYIYIGRYGNGTLNITGGGAVSSISGYIGVMPDSTGEVTVDGVGSTWTNDSSTCFYVGYNGSGTLNITGGGAVSNSDCRIGYESGSTGVVTVDGSGSTWTNGVNDLLIVGQSGSGTLNITDGGTVSNYNGHIGNSPGSTGVVTVDGAGSTWTNSNTLHVGGSGTGTLNITGGGAVSNSHCYIGFASSGEVTVDGAGSMWTNSGQLSIGEYGIGTLNITGGGTVSNNNQCYIGCSSGSTGEVTVDGSGSTWTNSGYLYVGCYGGQGTLNITNGGAVGNTYCYIGHETSSTGVVTVDGSGSTWACSDDLCVGHGYDGHGTLNITNGGAVSNTLGYIGGYSGSTGVVTVDGNGSTWTNSGYLYVGWSGHGTLDITNGGSVEVGDVLKIWNTGTVNLSGGVLTADSIDRIWSGAFNFTGGRLNVGTFIGNLVNNGGTLAPGASPGLTTIEGDYTQAASAAMEIEIGGLSVGANHDHVILTGTADLAGILELSLIGEYVPDFYDEFEILTAGTVSGTFDTITGVAADPDLYLAVVYNADNVTIVAAIPGDANLEGNVNDSDLSLLLSNFGTGSGGTWAKGDFNGDGAVDDSDLSILLTNFGATSESLDVPEPATILLLGFGGLALLRQRRK